MNNLSQILSKKQFELIRGSSAEHGIGGLEKINLNSEIEKKSKKGGAFHRWQDTAVRMWKKLGLEKSPSPSFFKCFRQNEAKSERVAYDLSDLEKRPDNIEKLFYWKLSH